MGKILVLYSKGSTVGEAVIVDEKANLESILTNVRAKFPALEWKLADVSEFGQDCYEAGYNSGEEACNG